MLPICSLLCPCRWSLRHADVYLYVPKGLACLWHDGLARLYGEGLREYYFKCVSQIAGLHQSPSPVCRLWQEMQLQMPPSRPCAVWTITALTRLKAQGMYKADALKSSAASRIEFQPSSDPVAQCVRLWSEWQAAGPARQPGQPGQAPAPMQPDSVGAGPPAAVAAVKAEADLEPAQATRHLSNSAEQYAPEASRSGGQERVSVSAGNALQMAPAEQLAMAAAIQSCIEGKMLSAAATCQLAASGTDTEEAQHASAPSAHSGASNASSGRDGSTICRSTFRSSLSPSQHGA